MVDQLTIRLKVTVSTFVISDALVKINWPVGK